MQQLPIKWKTDFVLVSPQDATLMLDRNEGNRRLRPGVVEKYCAIMAAGNWMLSPEPIVIADTGRMLNGQHRMSAVERYGQAQPFTIISNVPESVFPVLDRGAVRSTADALQIDKRLAEVSKIVLEVITGDNRASDADVRTVSAMLSADFADLIETCNSHMRVFSSAPFRAAAIVRLTAGYDRGFVLNTYRNLVLGRMHELHPKAQSIVAAVASGRLKVSVGNGGRKDLFVRAWDVFDPKKTGDSRIQIRDPISRIDEVKKIIDAAISTRRSAA